LGISLSYHVMGRLFVILTFTSINKIINVATLQMNFFAELLHGAIYFLRFYTKKIEFLLRIVFLATVKREKDEELSGKTAAKVQESLYGLGIKP